MSLDKALNLLDKMPEAPKPQIRNFDPPPGHYWCACHKKAIPLQKMRFLNTPFVAGCTDSLCDECLSDVRGMATVVCIICRTVVARMQPVKFPSGFTVRAGDCLHTDACPECYKRKYKQELVTSNLIEKHFYDEERGLPVKPLIK